MKKLLAGLTVVVLTFGFVAGLKAEEKEIKGKLGCAHCSFKTGEGCAVGVKAEDGKVYIVANADEKLMKARMKNAGKTIIVKGEINGDKITASSTKIEE